MAEEAGAAAKTPASRGRLTDRLLAVPLEIRTSATVLAIAIFMCATFAYAYTVALGRPFPRHLPIGVVGEPSPELLQELQVRAHEFDMVSYPSRDAAIAAVEQQQITAVIDAGGNPPQLLVSSASGSSTARVLTELVQTGPGQYRLPITDLNPFPPTDPAGLATFYTIIAATILGLVTMFQLRANVKTLTLRRWIGCVGVLAVAGGAAIAAVAGPLLDALQTPFWELWLLLALQVAITALFNSTMLVLIHRWAIIPTWAVFILLGNTSSGGAVSASLLPQPFALLNHALPSGAAVSAIHSATYFPEHQRALPFVVLALWLVGTFAALVVSSRKLNRTPANA
ncbi:DUF3533 domain-containing protein [Mycobacterium sp. MYCO198283]|uniref:DUF3533 domain-containing protein n=1 Tax=Mycobacterium sp. MYCO198283 TaxID=2883505 RepID=UPI001E2DB377|nr:DUF3533 domain-containing protein [Mycobacterium sp. MYCO198283]MCG5432426.1 DUF3533 domain-containing protein [Mycobacterium sp. MYCO198283]